MKEINEVELHLYFLNKSLLEDDVNKEIEKRLEYDQTLKDEFEEIKEFYVNLEQIENEKVTKTYMLAPLNLNSHKPENIVFAAQQSSTVEAKLMYVKTFISAEKCVIVRMFHNPTVKEYEFYVVCEGNENEKNACIKIPSMGIDLYSDENGHAKISAEYIPDDIELTVILQ
jgi:hypothetical protein